MSNSSDLNVLKNVVALKLIQNHSMNGDEKPLGDMNHSIDWSNTRQSY